MKMALNFTKSVSLGCRVFNFPIDMIEIEIEMNAPGVLKAVGSMEETGARL